MGGVDHDGGAEFPADRSGRRFGGVRGAEHVPDFPNGFVTFVHQRDARFRAGLVDRHRVALTRRAAGHKLDDVLELLVAGQRAEKIAERLFLLGRDFKPEFLFDDDFRFRHHCVVESCPQDFTDRVVKLHGFSGAHAMHLDADDVEAGAGKEIDDVAGAARGKAEVIRLD